VVERALRRRIAVRPEIELSGPGAAPELIVTIREIRADRLAGSDPALRAPRYRVRVHLEGRIAAETPSEPSRPVQAVGEDVFVARPGPIGRWDGAYRTFLERAAEDAADRLVDGVVARFTLTSG